MGLLLADSTVRPQALDLMNKWLDDVAGADTLEGGYDREMGFLVALLNQRREHAVALAETTK